MKCKIIFAIALTCIFIGGIAEAAEKKKQQIQIARTIPSTP